MMTAPDFFQKIEAPPEGAICDFCSSPDVHWTFPCRGHVTTEDFAAIDTSSFDVQTITIDGISSGGWAACNACHALILRGDRSRLARRSAKRLLRDRPGILPLGQAIAHIRKLHDNFWANREGQPIHHETRPREDPTA